MFGSLASECGKEKQSGEVINLERSCGEESQEHSHPGCGAGGHLACHPSPAPSRAAKFFRLPKPTKERNICCPRITRIDANHFYVPYIRFIRVILTRSASAIDVKQPCLLCPKLGTPWADSLRFQDLPRHRSIRK